MYAKTLGIMVVEPFAEDSTFEMIKLAPNFSKSLRFGDYFDKDKWNKMVVSNGGKPLVVWEEFISKAPRDAIILYTLKRPDLEEPLTIAYDDEVQPKCKLGTLKILKDDLLWLNSTFNLIRTVCYLCDQNKPHPIPIEEFTAHVFGNSKPSEVTLITVGWFGVRGTRLELQTKNKMSWALDEVPQPSRRIVKAYEAYKSRYIGDHKYIGVIFRTHHVLYFSPKAGQLEEDKYLFQCSKNLSHVLNKVRADWKIFLAYDMGAFGSINYQIKFTERLAPIRDQIFLDVFNGSLQIKEREEMLKQAAGGITDKGFIAQLEKVIATNADCIILLGAHSTFIRSSAVQYMSLHPTNKCVVSICSEQFRDTNRKIISSSTLTNLYRLNKSPAVVNH